ncbi:uncharacterized protein CANTADRAFT_27477 [Suhomyces tanzawaensis NRRL Y-17324]|uniref:Uncharacterized protein n=1 Tax=Suhomyces tanzawaensis NRRL Y-17324 TaxID=984487 RepID=A0A1E4SC57_9ASCO|nr:uncharacterized protein CANTADRAFT_27477 [Suhomyces tanzawaensis NRRL Y-17324]ODV77093.1 hypothetical protein CANTADRAFT_27477 [Suhomyces tanzawaensis NRRL Y-17324]
MSEHETVAAPLTPSFTSSSAFGVVQRRTSNFFPINGATLVSLASDLDFKLPSHHFDPAGSTPDSYPVSKRHNSSPLIGAYSGKTGTNASSRFFNSNESTPFFTTPTPSFNTPSYHHPPGQDLFSDPVAPTIDLAHNLRSLGLADSPPPAKPASSQSHLTIPSPPVSSTPMINLASSTTTSGSATPLLAASSIWNDNSIPSLGSLYGKNIKLGTLAEQIEHDVSSYSFGQPPGPTFTGLSTDVSFDDDFAAPNFPSLSKDLSFEDEFTPAGQFEDLMSPLLLNEDTLSKNKRNIFLSAVNNPSFVPSAKLKPAPPMKERTGPDLGLERTREFINTHKRRGDVTPSPNAKLAHKIQVSTHSKLKQIEKPKLWMSEQRSLLQKTYHEEKPLDSTKIKVRLPRAHSVPDPRTELSVTGATKKTVHTRSDDFTRDVLSSRTFSSKYAEDYCSTFYKRNSHGYMFIREPTNSLKVNSSGGKSWVELKIKLPSDGLPHQTDQHQQAALLLRKLRVDIKKLPIWKPINLNGSGPVKSSSTPKKYNGNFQLGYHYRKHGTGLSKETKKHKNLNVSKRFGKKEKAL